MTEAPKRIGLLRNMLGQFALATADERDQVAAEYILADEHERLMAEKDARIARLREALAWYSEQARLCRLIHSEGDAGRHALSEDGGKRARAALGDDNG